MVVPVEVALGRGTPAAWRAMFRLWLLKSKPGIVEEVSLVAVCVVRGRDGGDGCSLLSVWMEMFREALKAAGR